MLARHKLRRACVQGLYQIYLTETPLQEVLRFGWYHRSLDMDDRAFCSRIIRGTLENQDEIDRLIEQFSEKWSPDRIALLGRIVLEISIFSLRHQPEDAPPAVVIAEALELTEEFAGKQMVPFVHGILDNIHKSFKDQSS